MEMSYHMVFTGSPGTGKTTVARLVARIYRELGILSEGQLVETDRSRLVAGYVGQTAINVREIVEQAIGGVLFIDEAYALVSSEAANDFGSEAVDTLVKLMEDHRDNLVVIVAGYTEEMQVFLKSNTGLISRFNKFISFEDYADDQLLEILQVMVKRAGLVVEPEALETVGKRLAQMTPEERKDFGNARGVRNIFEKMVMNQANRVVLLEEPTKEQLMTLTGEDAVGSSDHSPQIHRKQ
jgi:SpoVK/Ycf46/Vps4 family AAA+-type ATPase